MRPARCVGGCAAGEVTDRVRAGFHDRVVFAAHVYEIAAIVGVFVLMITKPF